MWYIHTSLILKSCVAYLPAYQICKIDCKPYWISQMDMNHVYHRVAEGFPSALDINGSHPVCDMCSLRLSSEGSYFRYVGITQWTIGTAGFRYNMVHCNAVPLQQSGVYLGAHVLIICTILHWRVCVFCFFSVVSICPVVHHAHISPTSIMHVLIPSSSTCIRYLMQRRDYKLGQFCPNVSTFDAT